MENKVQEELKDKIKTCRPSWLNAYEILSSLEKAMEIGVSDYLKKFIDLDILKRNIELKKKYEMLREELSYSFKDAKKSEEITKEMEEISDAGRKGSYRNERIYTFAEIKEKGLEIWYKKKQT